MTPPWLACLPDAYDWVAAAYPAEGCGLFLERDGRWHFRPTANLAPSPRHAYMLDPLELIQADDRGERVGAIVHSHPDGAAVFSAADEAQALLRDGQPAFPGLDYVVIAVSQGRPPNAAAFRFDRGLSRFVRVWDTPGSRPAAGGR